MSVGKKFRDVRLGQRTDIAPEGFYLSSLPASMHREHRFPRKSPAVDIKSISRQTDRSRFARLDTKLTVTAAVLIGFAGGQILKWYFGLGTGINLARRPKERLVRPPNHNAARNRAFSLKKMAVSLHRCVAALAGLAFLAIAALIFSPNGSDAPTTLLSEAERQRQIAQIDQWEST